MDERFKKLIVNFLKKNFPITRVKKDGAKRFKRGITVDGGFTGKNTMKYYLNDKNDKIMLYDALYNVLMDVFGINSVEINPILLRHLNLV